MIITFTPNPSLDRTAPLAGSLQAGGVNRLGWVTTQAAGKGVNLSVAVDSARHPTLAIVPCDAGDPLAAALQERRVPARTVQVGHRARTNLTIAHPDGTTTKINEPGEAMTPENVSALAMTLMGTLPGASWLALCGSLPPGAPVDWYTRLTQMAREVGVRVALSTHGQALDAVMSGLPDAAPDLLSLNAGALTQVTGIDVVGAQARGEVEPAVDAVRQLVGSGVRRVLTTLGPLGAVLGTARGIWHADAAPVQVVSAVSSGDAALAGCLLALEKGAPDADALARAVAYGTACVGLPGSEVPSPDEADAIEVRVREV